MIALLICLVVSISAVIVSDMLINSYGKTKIFTSVESIPDNKVGLVLWTSKYIADGRRNLFYVYRLDAVKQLYDAKKIEYVLVSGDNGTPEYNEPDTMKRDLIEMWIPDEKIYADYAGFRTLDSIVRAEKIFEQSRYTIITQRFHLERALYLARSQGIEAIW